MQARALRRRCAVNGSMTVLGDLAQATGPHVPTSWDRTAVLLSDHGDWRVAELNTSYRVPAEIMEFVAPLAHAVAPTLPYPRAVREAGEDAVRTVETEPWKLLDDTVAQVTRLVGTSDGSTLRSVAVIVPDDSDWLDAISRRIDGGGDIGEQNREAVSVLAAAQAKGMEYDHVLVIEPATIADRGPAGLRQLYVALTRSTQSLTVLHTAPLPKELIGSGDNEAPEAPDARPEDTAERLPRIGADVRVEVVDRAPGGRYKVKPLSPVIDRPLVLTVRHGSVPPRRGEKLNCWVFANETSQTVLTSGQRGRSPVSPRMAGRYIAALDVLDELIESDGDVPDARGRLSELQGMANRVLRRDQADWVDVLHLFGSPDRDKLGVLRDLAATTNRAQGGHLEHRPPPGRPDGLGLDQTLAEARRALQSRYAADAGPDSDDVDPDDADLRDVDPADSDSDDVDPAAPQQPEQKDEEQMAPAESTTAPASAPASGSRLQHRLQQRFQHRLRPRRKASCARWKRRPRPTGRARSTRPSAMP